MMQGQPVSGVLGTNREGILVELKESKLRISEITFFVVVSHANQTFRGMRSKAGKIVYSKTNGHTDRCQIWTPYIYNTGSVYYVNPVWS